MIFQIDPSRHPRGFTRDMPSIMPLIYPNKESITDPVFGNSSGYPSLSHIYKQTKDNYKLPIIN